ncbi:nitroreductase family protein [bacterium F11]|nr:nitroreductase family protein [bacterium F11]
MDIFDAIKKRRSIRDFSPDTISNDQLSQMIDAARYAPTARGIEPWEFVVVKNKETLGKIGELADHGRFIAKATACVVVYCKDTKYYLEDGSAATQNILLAATALGIASCWVAGDKKEYCPQLSALLKVPPHFKCISLVALGYPPSTKLFRVADKRKTAEVLHWETF